MDKRQAEVERLTLEYEKQCLKDLQKSYTEALADVKLRLKGLLGREEQTQSVIYQIQLQEQIQQQLETALNRLKSGSITSVTDFLNKTYEDSYLGVIYGLQGQGIPINIGIDHDQLARTVNRKTDTLQFSDRLYKNVDNLGVAFKSQMSRGIANGSAYSKIAKQLAMESEASYKQAMRIVRTEGGRVKSEAKLNSMKAAKNEGADIVKQWDATFDGKTRPEHRFLEGQIREIDEPFTDSQGREAQAPHKFGVASMDINCRCIVVERARWAVEGEEMPNKVNNDTGDLVEAKDYKEWKEKAAKQLEENKQKQFDKKLTEIEQRGKNVFDKDTGKVPAKGDYFRTVGNDLIEVVEVNDYNGIKSVTLANGQTVVLKNAKARFTPAKTIAEAEQYAGKFSTNVSYKGAKNLDNVNAVNEQLEHLTTEYPTRKLSTVTANARLRTSDARANYQVLEIKTSYLDAPSDATDYAEYNKEKLKKWEAVLGDPRYDQKKIKKGINGIKEDFKYSRWTVSDALSGKDALKATITHEYGHILSDQITGISNGKRACPAFDYIKGNEPYALQTLIKSTYARANASGDIYKISRYAATDAEEFFSETFTMYDLGEDLPDYIVEMIEKVVKK